MLGRRKTKTGQVQCGRAGILIRHSLASLCFGHRGLPLCAEFSGFLDIAIRVIVGRGLAKWTFEITFAKLSGSSKSKRICLRRGHQIHAVSLRREA